MKIRDILILIVTIVLAACSEEYESQVALSISAVIDNSSATRAVEEMSKFAANDAIGVSTSAKENRKYTFDGGSWSSDAPLYYQDANAVEFKAYSPYSSEVADGVVTTEAKDYLFAEGEGSVENPMVKFTFNHMMSKICLSFTIIDSSMKRVSEFSVTGIYTKGTFNTLTGAANGTSSNSYQDGTMSSDTLGSLIIFPQTTPDDVYVVAKIGGVNYRALLCKKGSSFRSNTVYNYNVGISKSGLTVSESTSISEWTTQTITVAGDKNAADKGVNIYSLAMNDDTFIDLSDGEGGLSSDYTSKIAQLTDEEKSKIIGIVYYTGNDPSDQNGIDLEDFKLSDYNHGLIVALKYVTSGETTDKGETPGNNDTENMMYWQAVEATVGVTKYDEYEETVLGYYNTMKLLEYNKRASAKVLPASCFEADGWNKSENASYFSNWFIPSVKELRELNDVKSNINQILLELSKVIDASQLRSTKHWSSSEDTTKKGNKGYAYCISFSTNTVQSSTKLSNKAFVRPVCAF